MARDAAKASTFEDYFSLWLQPQGMSQTYALRMALLAILALNQPWLFTCAHEKAMCLSQVGGSSDQPGPAGDLDLPHGHDVQTRGDFEAFLLSSPWEDFRACLGKVRPLAVNFLAARRRKVPKCWTEACFGAAWHCLV